MERRNLIIGAVLRANKIQVRRIIAAMIGGQWCTRGKEKLQLIQN